MPKPAKLRSSFLGEFFMGRTSYIATAALAIAGGYWLWNYNPSFWDSVQYYVENGEIMTLEARYTPEQIMESHRRELLVDAQHTYDVPEAKFHPYLLMDVKYIDTDRKTREGVILWSLLDGEMVINTDTWDKTHGFEDAINVDASANDFRILNALARNGGQLTKDQLQKELHVENDALTSYIDGARKKQLIIQKGNILQLHFQNPKILVSPQTKINHWLVTKPYEHAQRITRKYSNSQVERTAKAAFGTEFTIRNMQEVFLPVYRIGVLNPDGSILTTYWNALNGQRINPKYMTVK